MSYNDYYPFEDGTYRKYPANIFSERASMRSPHLGKFFAIDPLIWKYSYNSPYAFSENKVIDGVELEEGLEFLFSADGKF